jgi:hypothetical protein
MTEQKDSIQNPTIISQHLSSTATSFSLEYLKKNLQLIDVAVPSYETDFMDHTVLKILFRTIKFCFYLNPSKLFL